MSAINPTKVIIPCRISYAHLFEPTSVNGSDPKYGASLIVSKKHSSMPGRYDYIPAHTHAGVVI